MKKLTIVMFVAAALLLLHSAFSALSYDPPNNYEARVFFDSLLDQTTVTNMAAVRMNVRVEISESELREVDLLTGIAAAQQQQQFSRPASIRVDTFSPTSPLIGSLSK